LISGVLPIASMTLLLMFMRARYARSRPKEGGH
jgi:hypothetical protein